MTVSYCTFKPIYLVYLHQVFALLVLTLSCGHFCITILSITIITKIINPRSSCVSFWFPYEHLIFHIMATYNHRYPFSYNHRISEKNLAEVEQKLLKADYHGSEMRVTKTKCDSLLGQEGIVVRETKNTWIIIRKDNALKSR